MVKRNDYRRAILIAESKDKKLSHMKVTVILIGKSAHDYDIFIEIEYVLGSYIARLFN